MAHVSMHDLLKRWTRPPKGRGVFTRQGVYKALRWPDFPAPAVSDGTGLTKLWHPADIDAFESRHPEFTDELAKRRKIRKAGYAALMRKRGNA